MPAQSASISRSAAAPKAKAQSKSARLYSLDVLRGLTVAAMIIVNNAGGPESYSFLQHSVWNGLTLCDMVFPTFLFIVGISTYISLGKKGFQWSQPIAMKILKRTVLILLIGWAIHWLEHIVKADFLPLATLRLTGVLPRIAVCYFLTSVIALSCGKKDIEAIIVCLLVLYGWILLAGNGFVNEIDNILVRFDRALLGEAHLYTKQPVDPEGLMSNLSALAHTLIGFCCGRMLMAHSANIDAKMLRIMVIGFGMLLVGLAIAVILPINKRIWSPSYVLVSCALAAMTLVAIAYIADIKGRKRGFWPFDVFGVNPLFLYVLAEVAAILLSASGAKRAIYGFIEAGLPDPKLASATYSLLFVCAIWAVGYWLYRNKIYIKL